MSEHASLSACSRRTGVPPGAAAFGRESSKFKVQSSNRRSGGSSWSRGACGVLMCAAFLILGAQVAPDAPRPGETDAPAKGQAPGVRFTHFDVFLDAGDKALGAYQVELRCTTSNVTLVGIEGGEHGAYKEPPYYDPAALHNPRGSRVILAAFNTGADLPAGKTRVARIHVQVAGPAPEFQTRLVAAADSSGGAVEAAVTLVAGEDK
jgi:hypothetical protein